MIFKFCIFVKNIAKLGLLVYSSLGFLMISIIDGDKIDDTIEEVALYANIFQHKDIALIKYTKF